MLKSEYPELAKEWDEDRNAANGLFINDIAPGSGKMAWWVCAQGHSYQRTPYDRCKRNLGCPYCSHRRLLEGFNDFATEYPDLLKEWDYRRNNKLGIYPNRISVGFREKVWWVCPNGHSYYSVIHPRTHGVGCPYCSGRSVLKGFNDIATTNPEILSEWDYEKNKIKPTEVSRGYSKNVYWLCKKGHSYESLVINRIKGCGCPYCSNHKAVAGVNDLFTQFPELRNEWDYEKNSIDPTTIVRGGKQKFWWKCKRGHEWYCAVSSRIRNDNTINRCPICSRRMRISFPEKIIYFYVHKAFPNAIENYRPNWFNKKEFDIFIPDKNIGIEYDGVRYHKNTRDIEKDKLCKENGVKLIRIREKGTGRIRSSSIVYTLTDTYRPDGGHIVPGLRFLEEQLGVDFGIDLSRDYDEIRSLVENFDIENCIAKTNPEVLFEWDYEKNMKLGITPENVSAGASIYAWWKCDKGHSYKAILPNKINGGTGCPYCAGKRILKGFNDLATTEPDLLKKWDYKKNKIKPTDVSYGSNKKIWLICDKGHSYSVALLNHKKSGCPYCSGHKVLAGFNDLATTHPELLDEWDYQKNKIKPTEIGKGHEKKVWWKCKKGHSYFTSPNRKTSKNAKCPYCSGQRVLAGFNDIATTNPELLKEWDYKKNTIKPTEISKGSGKKIWLKCENGHSYETTVPSRLAGHKCNYCSNNRVLKGFNDIATTDPDMLKVWNDNVYSPYELSRKSSKIISCKCPSCNYEWTTKVYNLTNQRKCPGCKKDLLDL